MDAEQRTHHVAVATRILARGMVEVGASPAAAWNDAALLGLVAVLVGNVDGDTVAEVWAALDVCANGLLGDNAPNNTAPPHAIDDWRTALLGVALEPEQVGAVYARMLGMTERWEDADVTGQYGAKRKSRGTYVTPRRLAEVLVQDLGQPPGDARVCDPACGSGALLLAWLRHRQNPSDAVTRVYGLDADPVAVVLCRLALWVAAGRPPEAAAPLRAHIAHGDALFGPSPPGAPTSTVPLPPGPPPFDWQRQWPEVWADGGFQIVVVNPPWERVKAQARDILRWQRPDAAAAAHKAERDNILEDDADAQTLLRDAKGIAAARSRWLRSGAFPWSAHGDVNLFGPFVERTWHLLNKDGVAGVIVPTGVATDYGHRHLWGALLAQNAVEAFYDFENRKDGKRWFQAVDSRFRFALCTLRRRCDPVDARQASIDRVATLLRDPDERALPGRTWSVTAQTLATVNPETGTLPMWRDARAARRNEAMHAEWSRQLPEDRWKLSFQRLFDMTNDAPHFRTATDLEAEGATATIVPGVGPVFCRGEVRWIPLTEGKMFWILDGGWAGFVDRGGEGRRDRADLLPRKGQQRPHPRFWVEDRLLHERLSVRGVTAPDSGSWLVIRALTNPTNMRTLVPALVPACGVGNSALIVHIAQCQWQSPEVLLAGNLGAIVLDDVARQKMGNTNVNMFHLRQLPLLPLSAYADAPWQGPTVAELVARRVVGLSGRHVDVALGMGKTCWAAPPIVDAADRRRARAELDALFAHLYGFSEADLADVLDPPAPTRAFQVLRKREQEAFGCFMTRDLVLDAYRTIGDWARTIPMA